MKKLVVFCSLWLVFSCDDGDNSVPEFNFTSSISNCGNLTLYKINERETLALVISADNTDNDFLNQERTDVLIPVTQISYRTFNSEPSSSYFCQPIPPASPTIIDEWIGTGDLYVSSELSQDDNDTVTETNLLLDSDGDGIFDYIDSDDDNDGLATKDEFDGDSDGDGIDDYLDDDDDNDGVPTRNESITADIDGDGIKDYLDPDTTTSNTARSVTNSYTQTYVNTFTLVLLKLEKPNGRTIQYDTYDFGTRTTTKTVAEEL